MSKQRVDEQGMGPLEKGRKRYQEKDYKSALRSFHEGYLRCAKVLQSKGENDLALKIYQRGLSKVQITGADNERQKLQSFYNKLRQAQNPGKSLDPLEFLPLELAQMVVENLELRDRVICLAVTKSWKRLLESSHKSTRKPVSFNALKLHLKRSNYTLDRAIISTKAYFDVKRFEYLFRTCKRLSTLEICGSGVIGDTLVSALPRAKCLETISCGVNCEISLRTVQTVLRTCQETLREATFLRVKGSMAGFVPNSWPELRRLRILNLRCFGDAILEINGLRDSIPNIKSLTLTYWDYATRDPNPDLSSLKEIETLSLTNSHLRVMPLFPPSLKNLKISHNRQLGAYVPGNETYDLPHLESFDCSGSALTNLVVKAFTLQSIKAGTLKRLYIGDRLTEYMPGTPVEDEYPASNSVEELSIASMILREKRLMEIVALYPNLQRLDVSGTKITGVAVKQLVQMGIRWLKLDECSEVSPDAVDYARGKGVDVQFNFPSRSGRLGSFRDASYAGVI
ncbi:hypothetical protein D0Z07_0160 [Hyphodiscus hymeniophilus]|uniref:F-box domain-containing protein n=1 Tax=Hyphodiscus hymeniophilus TaxID=353542 RepID=A0A9P6VQY1_9HELO|nr:hypothetical protein D0Z07_0160 [Hyphodiscus hymeniophilus]